jgi:chorismate lyase/3-hydroxybenzoate synthase
MQPAVRAHGSDRKRGAWRVGNSASIDRSGLAAMRRASLQICLTPGLRAAPDGRELLLAFHFGRDTANTGTPGVVTTGIDPIGQEDLFECWWYDGPVEHRQVGNVRIADCADFAAVVIQVADATPENFRAVTRDLYEELLAAIGQTRHRNIVRFWNYFSNINLGEGDAEKYRQFSVGRAEAFEACGLTDEVVPAATGIGSARDCEFTVIALASKHDFHNVENPRQVSAYNYPADYGPRSPKFSRAGCVSIDDQQLLLISGTASIIGHESVHAGDAELQCKETANNLRKLSEKLAEVSHVSPDAVLDTESVVRVYIRNAEDLDCVSRCLEELLGGRSANVAYLNAHICRSELQIEIDAAKMARMS